MEPMASRTASETRFSEGISSRPVAWRRASSRRRSAICGSTESSGRFIDRKSTRLNSSHLVISYAVFCLKKKHTRHRESVDAIEAHHMIDANRVEDRAAAPAPSPQPLEFSALHRLPARDRHTPPHAFVVD